MTESPRSNTTYYTDGQDLGFLIINEAIQRLENGPTLVVLDTDATTPAGLPNVPPLEGDACVIGVGAATTAFESHDGELAMYYGGWIFRDLRDGEVMYDAEKFTVSWRCPVLDEVRPLNAPRQSAAASDDGTLETSSGSPLRTYRKIVDCGAAPDGSGAPATASTAHGVSFPTAKGRYARVHGVASDGTKQRALPWSDGTNYLTLEVDGTNVVVGANWNATGWDVLVELYWSA